MFVVVKIKKYEVHEGVYDEKFYVGKAWRTRDKLLFIPGVDAITRDAVVRRHRQKKKDGSIRSVRSLRKRKKLVVSGGLHKRFANILEPHTNV